jgi:hypothetical protein
LTFRSWARYLCGWRDRLCFVGSGLLCDQFCGDHVKKLWHGFVYLLIALFVSSSTSLARCSARFRWSGGSESSHLRPCSCILRSNSSRLFSDSPLNLDIALDNSAAPGGGMYVTSGYSPTWILILPGGSILSSRIISPAAPTGHPRCTCQLYECRKSTSVSAISPAFQMGCISSERSAPTYGCISTPSLISLTVLSGLTSHLAEVSTPAILSAALRASLSGTNSINAIVPANAFRGSMLVLPLTIQFGITRGALGIVNK